MSFPTTFPAQNSHRVVQFNGENPKTDFERLEDIAADGLRALRRALDLLPELPTPVFNGLHAETKALRAHIDRRRLLTDQCRLDLEVCLTRIDGMALEDDQAPEIARLAHLLGQALGASHRVADLLAAEKEIGFHRGIR